MTPAELDSWRSRQDCADLFTGYANGVDFRDYDRVISLFAPDAVVLRKGRTHAGREAIWSMLCDRQTGYAIRHVISNADVVLRNDKAASGLCYYTAYIEPGADDAVDLPFTGPAVMGEIHADFRLTEDGWKFARFDARLTYVRSAE